MLLSSQHHHRQLRAQKSSSTILAAQRVILGKTFGLGPRLSARPGAPVGDRECITLRPVNKRGVAVWCRPGHASGWRKPRDKAVVSDISAIDWDQAEAQQPRS